jgi:hypothetical protein
MLLTLLASIAFLTPRAQTHVPPGSGIGFTPWQLRSYASVSAGYLFLGRGGMSYFSAPVGVALYRRLNSNFTAFAGVNIAPTVFNMSRLYTDPAYPANRFTNLGVNAGIQGGLIYTNDAKTFSISGSISVERGSYPVYSPPRNNTTKRQ